MLSLLLLLIPPGAVSSFEQCPKDLSDSLCCCCLTLLQQQQALLLILQLIPLPLKLLFFLLLLRYSMLHLLLLLPGWSSFATYFLLLFCHVAAAVAGDGLFCALVSHWLVSLTRSNGPVYADFVPQLPQLPQPQQLSSLPCCAAFDSSFALEAADKRRDCHWLLTHFLILLLLPASFSPL